MCGISAIFSKSEPIQKEQIIKSLVPLHHRGPNNHGYWLSEDGKTALGHTRLSIIDLEGGQQPMTSQCNGNIHAVVNGEFYDYKKIRTELKEKGHRFLTKSDSEILIHLYEEYGTSCLEYLRGEFAFVLWDSSNQRLFVGKDRFGIKPLFYSFHQDKLYIASEVKALLAVGVPAGWDEEFYYQSCFCVQPVDRTLFKGIHAVPPGHFLLAEKNNFKVLKYWDLNYPLIGERDSKKTEIDHLNDFQKAFEESIKLRLVADVPVASYLSGGIDSCAVLGMAQSLADTPIKAYTLTFKDSAEHDESKSAEEMAKHVGAEYNSIDVSQADLADSFSDAIWYAENMVFNGNSIAKFILSREVQKDGCKVVLTGEGSDEILAGYSNFRQDYLSHHTQGMEEAVRDNMLKKLEELNRVTPGYFTTELDLPEVKKILGFVPFCFTNVNGWGKGLMPFFDSGFTEKYKGQKVWKGMLDYLDVSGQLKGREKLDQSLYIWAKTILPTYTLAMLGDRMEMAHSLEGRVPFLDHKLVEAVVKMPVDMKINKNVKGGNADLIEKHILRWMSETCKFEEGKSIVTPRVIGTRKHPFTTPPALFSKEGNFYQLLQDTIRGPQLAAMPFYNQKKLIETLDKIPSMEPQKLRKLDDILMLILSSCIIQDRFRL